MVLSEVLSGRGGSSVKKLRYFDRTILTDLNVSLVDVYFLLNKST